MAKISVSHLVTFSTESPAIVGERAQVQAALNNMFDALGRYERDNDIELKGIVVSTSHETEDWEDPQLVKYRITATSYKTE